MRKHLPRILFTALLLALTVMPFGPAQTAGPVVSSRFKRATFGTLGTPPNDAVRYCTNCQATSPCTSGGSGAVASRVNGAWNCSNGGSGSTGGTTVTSQHFAGTGTAPTCGANTTTAGTGAGCTLTGSDSFGKISVGFGSGPTGNGPLATITFNSPYSTAPYCVFSPANEEAAIHMSENAGNGFFTTTTTTTFAIFMLGSPGLIASLDFHYHCGQ